MTETKETHNGPLFTLHNIYVKDCSFEAPNTPQIFNTQWKPKLDFDLQMSSHSVMDDIYEVILHVTLTVKVPDKDTSKVAFLTEIQQAGVFTVKGVKEEALNRVLATTCPGLLFPYLRETVSNLVLKGGFPQVLLPPMNFDALYLKHQKEKKEKPNTAANESKK